MASFKLKLVGYFLLLSLLPLVAAFWGFSAVATRSEERRVDARIQAGLRATLAAYEDELDQATEAAQTLAGDRGFQAALARRDRAGVERELGNTPNLRIVAGNGFRVGRAARPAAERHVLVVGPEGSLGKVIASVRLDRALLRRLRVRSGLPASDHVVLVQEQRVVAGPGFLQGSIAATPGRAATISLAGDRYRALVADSLERRSETTIGVVTSQAEIDSAGASTQRRLLAGLIGALILIAMVAYLEGRSIVRTIASLVEAANAIARGQLSQRVPVRGRDELARLGLAFNDMARQLEERLAELESERRRLRDATTRFGAALAATHDVDQLLRVIVETAVEASGARGGVLLGHGRSAEAGDRRTGQERLDFPLRAGRIDFGTLSLFGESFSEEERMNAASLAAQAAVALDNERLHRIVERQALVDGLTGLANRRHCEETLAAEVTRAERFGDPLALVVTDLDDFKDVNDAYGHAVGDLVLRDFATLLSKSVREIDLAARWGGEEFVLVLPGTDGPGARRLAERIRATLQRHVVVSPESGPIRVTASFGVAAFPDLRDAAGLFHAADEALYAAKRGGKNRVEAAPKREGVHLAG